MVSQGCGVKMNIIGLIGAAGSGKDAVANFLRVNGYIQITFAKPLKIEIGVGIFGLTPDQVFGSKEAKETVDDRYGKTPREILQVAGMAMRDICPNIWVDKALSTIESFGGYTDSMSFVVSDVRFLNEVEALKQRGAKIWRIKRAGSGARGGVAYHPSEMELANYPDVDLEIDNNGTLEQLGETIDSLLTEPRGGDEL